MKLRAWLCAAVALLSVAASFAADAFDKHCANPTMLQDRRVQKEVGITVQQRAALNRHADWFNGRTKALRERYAAQAKGKKTPPKPPVSEVRALEEQMKTRLLGVLADKQIARLREISLQQAGDAAVLDAMVARRLAMTDAQVKTIGKAYRNGSTKAAQIQNDALKAVVAKYQGKKPANAEQEKALKAQVEKDLAAARKRVGPQVAALVAKFKKTVAATLTMKQRDEFAALKGKPFRPK